MRWLALLVGLIPAFSLAQGPLEDCRDQFINGDTMNAPTVFNSAPDEPFDSNQHVCFHDDDASFFAMEHWPEHFAPRWTAYKLSPQNYGEGGCNTYTRSTANCYFGADTWDEFESCTGASDPFHSDHMLSGSKLGTRDFSNTGHDRGHIAPRQAFSWHVCGTYQTFSMANMSPQRAYLNQDIWRYLEKQVLAWAMDEGPIYVVTGTMFRRFPHWRFDVYRDNALNVSAIYSRDSTMQNVVAQHHENFDTHPNGHILRPKRDADPERVEDKIQNMRVPTGYFKVVYRPAMNGEQAHAIGFLLPHTFENLNMLTDRYEGLDTKKVFWAFVSRIDLIEEASGVTFPGISQEMKSQWGDNWFFDHDTVRDDLRSESCGRGSPKGVITNSLKEERLEACIDMLN